MKKLILSCFAVAIVAAATILPMRDSFSQENNGGCPTCVKDHMMKHTTCFVVLGYYSNQDKWVFFGTGDKKKCKLTPNAFCDSDKQNGCEKPK